jgi:signal transduction histidine kinase
MKSNDLCEDADSIKNRFTTLFENSPVSVQFINPSGTTQMVNPSWQKLWSLPDDFIKEFIFKSYNIFQDPILVRQGFIPYFERALKGETVFLPLTSYDPAEMGHATPKRVTRPIIVPVKNKHMEVQELMLLHEDITDQLIAHDNKQFLAKMAEILLESLDYDMTLERVAAATIPYLADGCIVDIIENDIINRLVCKHRDPEVEKMMHELAKKYPPKICSPAPTPRVIRNKLPELSPVIDLEVIAERTVNDEHKMLINNSGLTSHMAVPLTIRGQVIGALNFWISTERRPHDEKDIALAQEVARFAALAIENARLYRDAKKAVALREEFISIASHELKTPVTAMMLQMEIIQSILKDKGALDIKMLSKMGEKASQSLDRLSSLIEDMLDLSRLESRRLSSNPTKRVDLGEIILQSVTRFSDQLKQENIELTTDLDDNILVDCDPLRMEQVMVNLISNAITYGLRKPICISLKKEGHRAMVRVKDKGPGILLEDQSRIFERFERGAEGHGGQGLGLGLYISRQIILEQNGSIHVESCPGPGATFIIALPLSAGMTSMQDPASARKRPRTV